MYLFYGNTIDFCIVKKGEIKRKTFLIEIELKVMNGKHINRQKAIKSYVCEKKKCENDNCEEMKKVCKECDVIRSFRKYLLHSIAGKSLVVCNYGA